MILALPLLAVSIQSNLGTFWVAAGALLLILFSFWSYRWTQPPLPRWGKLGLALLRALALLATWLLVVQFAIHWSFERPRKTEIAVLIDNSESMALVDGAGDRANVLADLVGLLPEGPFADRVVWDWYRFAEDLNRMENARLPDLNGPVTDLDKTFRSLATSPDGLPDAVILFSDGAVNRGGPPTAGAREFGVPIYAVGIGDSLAPRDLVITSVSNALAGYVGEEQPLDVTLRATGLNGSSAEVRLFDENGSLVERKRVDIGSDWDEQTVTFTEKPDRSGINSWRVEVQPVEGEIDTSNNWRRATMRAADRRRSVLLFAGAPNPDVAALARALEEDQDTEVFVLIAAGRSGKVVRGSFADAADLGRFDAAIVTLQQTWGRDALSYLQTLSASTLPMMIVTGDEPDRSALQVVEQRLGGIRSQSTSDEAVLLPTGPHAILTQMGTWFEGGETPPPLQLPPVGTRNGLTVADATVQGRTRSVISSTSSPRTLSWFAGGLWRWDLGRRTEDPAGNGYRDLLDRILRYMVTPEDQERMVLAAERDLVSKGETAQLSVRVQDEARRPVDNARVVAQVSHNGEERTVEFRPEGGGRYQAAVSPWGEGRYKVDAQIVMDGETATRSTEFMVDPFHLEMAELRMRPDRLRGIAQATGGAFLLPDQIDTLPELLPLEEGVEEIIGTWRPFGLWLTLLLIVGLLAIEWIVRTRTGMV